MRQSWYHYDIATGRPIRRGKCQSNRIPIPREGQALGYGSCDPKHQKVINGELVAHKWPIKHAPVLPDDKKPARITNEQWQAILDRLTVLEARADG